MRSRKSCWQEALDTAQRGIAVDPDEPSLYNFVAAYCHLGRCEGGITTAQHYVELTAGEANAHDSLGTAYAWVGRYDGGEQAYRAAIASKPGFLIAISPGGAAFLGRTIREGGLGMPAVHSDLARTMVEKFSGDDSVLSEVPALDRGDHSVNLLTQPKPIGSMEWFEDSLGDAFLRSRRFDAAIAEYRHVLGINPNQALARDEYRRFLATWQHTDSDIPEVQAARANGPRMLSLS